MKNKLLVTAKYVFISFWLSLIGTGFYQLFAYANTQGIAAQAQRNWPKKSYLELTSHQGALVVFLHPRCPCSSATVGELERLVSSFKSRLKVYAVFVKPRHLTDSWAQESLWLKAQEIPGVQVVLDQGGAEASNFDAKTSGQSFLYDRLGTLIFQGGITPERGHMGDSPGREAILQYLETGSTGIKNSPVFGCSLENPEWAENSKDNHEQH